MQDGWLFTTHSFTNSTLAEDWDEDCWVKSLLALALRLTFLFVLICTVTVPAEVEDDLKLAPAMFGPLLLDAGLAASLSNLLLLLLLVCPISSTVMNPGSETPAGIRIELLIILNQKMFESGVFLKTQSLTMYTVDI